MNRLKTILEKYSRWQPLNEYVRRIEGFRETDFSLCIENSKALLESIAKELCSQKKQSLSGSESIGKLLGLSFGCLGYAPTDTIRQIGSAISNIGQQMGNFRNEIGTTSHGKTLDELRNRQTTIKDLTGDFLIQSMETVCCFLIETFEVDNPLITEEKMIMHDDNPEFNSYWDESYGNITIADDTVYSASEILHGLEYEMYKQAVLEYNSSPKENES